MELRDGRATVTGSRQIRKSGTRPPRALPDPGRLIPTEERDALAGPSVRRLLLVRHAPTSATRSFAFPLDEPLDERGRADAGRLASAIPRGYDVLCSPARRCVQTAQGAGLDGSTFEAALGECDFGSWAGRTLESVAAADPRGVSTWMTDPSARPHGGESHAKFVSRVASWLDDQATREGGAVAITHGGVVKAAIVHALGAPLQAFWRVDAAPLSITELHASDGRWILTRVNCGASR